jgi:hypothetical protein
MNAKPVLILSLVGNLALALALVVNFKSKPVSPESGGTPTAPAPPRNAAGAPLRNPEAGPSPATPVAGQQFDWRLVESEDYKKYIANLRAIGCPEETIRDIIVADVNKLYENKRKQLAGPKKKFEYWKPSAMMGAAFDPERTEKERALNKEKRALITELLGSAPDDKPDILAGAASQLEAMFDFIPAEKRSRVFEMMQDMQTKMQKAMKGGGLDPEDIRKAMKESETALAGILSPEELLDYNLRFSMTANMMRMQLAGFEPTEQEFLDLFKKRKAYDDEFGLPGMGALSKMEKEKADAAKKELDGQVKALLGDSRFTDYERAQSLDFQSIYRVADKNDLTKDDAVKVYDMKKVAEAQAKQVRTDPSLSSEQRTAALQGIRTETENSIRTVFGAKAFDAYVNQPGTYWLKGISPDPKPATPAPPPP